MLERKVALQECDKAAKMYKISQMWNTDGNLNLYFSFLYAKEGTQQLSQKFRSVGFFGRMIELTHQHNAKKMQSPATIYRGFLIPRVLALLE